MICPHCGAHIYDGAKFCNACGKRLEVSPYNSSFGQPGSAHDSKHNKEKAKHYTVPSTKSQKRNGTIIVLSIIVAICMAAIIFLLIRLLNDESDTTQQNNTMGVPPSIMVPTLTPEANVTYTPQPEPTPDPTEEVVLQDELVRNYYYAPSEDRRVYFNSATASSEVYHNGISYAADRAIDDNPNTSWQENADGYGIGEYITLHFDSEQTVSGIMLFPGFDQSESAWLRNGRPARLQVEISDGRSYQIEVDDLQEWQGYEFSTPVETSYIRFTILDVYESTQWEDTAITDIRAYK